jgi:hypothetical protein
MKKIIIILLIPVFTQAQKLDGAWGLTWGISVDSTIKIIKENKGYTPEIQRSDTLTDLIFTNVKWGLETSISTRVQFYKDSLYSIVGHFIPTEPEEFFKTYKSLKNSITEKYFAPQRDIEEYKKPYTKDDSDTKKVHAILNGYGNVECAWEFLLASKFENNGLIALKITSDWGIVLWYQDGKISEIINKQVYHKLNDDF